MSILKTVAVALIGAVAIGLNAGVAPAQADDSSPQASIQEDEDDQDDDLAEVDDDDDEDDDGIDLAEVDDDDDDDNDEIESDDIIVEAPDSPSPSTVTEIPTPALLPGLIGMGVAALRKRQQEQSESSEE
jgi:hypothetical protein